MGSALSSVLVQFVCLLGLHYSAELTHCDGCVEFREISHRGEATRCRAEAEEIIAADSCDRRSDQGAGNSLQKSSEVQEERKSLQSEIEVECGQRYQDDVSPLFLQQA